MIKKLFSKAFLAVVMDKNARDNLEARKKRKPAPADALTPGPPKAPMAKPPDAMETEDAHQLILDSLRAAQQELSEKRDMTPERQALIQQALDLQRSKAHVLKDLSTEEREKLYVIALKTLEGDLETAPSRRGGRGGKGKKAKK